MTGGIQFSVSGILIRDQWGNLVMCTLCGGTRWDVTGLGSNSERIECAAAGCGQPVTDPAGRVATTRTEPAAGG